MAWRPALPTEAGSASASVPESARASALAQASAGGLGQASGSISEPGSGLVSEAGSGLVSEAGSGLVSEAGSGLVSEAGSGLVSEAGSGLVSEAGSGLVSEAGSGLVSEAGSGSSSAAGSGVASPSGSRPVEERSGRGCPTPPVRRATSARPGQPGPARQQGAAMRTPPAEGPAGNVENVRGTSRSCGSSERAGRTYARATGGASRPRKATSMVRASPRAMTCEAPVLARDAQW